MSCVTTLSLLLQVLEVPLTRFAEFWSEFARGSGGGPVAVCPNRQLLKVKRCGFGPWIHSIVTSEETGFSKPDGRIFDHALARAGAAPSEAVMLGNAWVADIEGARMAGIPAGWFNRAGRPSRDPAVPELAAFEPLVDAVAVLRRAGLSGPKGERA